MKETLISLTICLLSTFSLAQNMERESFDSNIQEVLKNRFNGGFDAFARFFYSQVNMLSVHSNVFFFDFKSFFYQIHHIYGK